MRLDPWKELHVKISFSSDHVVQDVLKILVLSLVRSGKVVGLMGEAVLRHEFLLEVVHLTKVGFESVLLGDVSLSHGMITFYTPPIYTRSTVRGLDKRVFTYDPIYVQAYPLHVWEICGLR